MPELQRVTEIVEGTYRSESTQELILLRDVKQALIGLQHGEITITVRNGKVIEIERVARSRPKSRNGHESRRS